MADRMVFAASAAFASMLVMDLPWVTLNTKMDLYKGHVNGVVTNRAAVGALWVSIVLINACLVAYIASTASKWWTAMLASMFAGLAVYGTFNGTALVVCNSWPGKTAAGDTAWGIILFGVAGVAAYFAAHKGKPKAEEKTL